MKRKNRDRIKMNQAIRDTLLEASEAELREALSGGTDSIESLAARGRAVAQRALELTAAAEHSREDAEEALAEAFADGLSADELDDVRERLGPEPSGAAKPKAPVRWRRRK